MKKSGKMCLPIFAPCWCKDRSEDCMVEVEITRQMEGQRFDKWLKKYLPEATSGFIYKMLRKKNIVLNDKKSDGTEKLFCGDSVKLFFSDQTLEKFRGEKKEPTLSGTDTGKLEILYEDRDILVVNKPVDMLSQKAHKDDISMVEIIEAYLCEKQRLKDETGGQSAQAAGFKPGLCNRLDRNTSGILVAGKSMPGLQTMNRLFKERKLRKYYLCIVKGKIRKPERIDGYLTKQESHNRVTIRQEETPGASYIQTEYEPLATAEKDGGEYTLLKVHLITGKSHQIRAHLKSIGHPIVGDGKYGHKDTYQYFKKQYHLTHQLLHGWRLELGEIEGELAHLSGRTFEAPLPQQFAAIRKDIFGM